jgi:hypothetical protein
MPDNSYQVTELRNLIETMEQLWVSHDLGLLHDDSGIWKDVAKAIREIDNLGDLTSHDCLMRSHPERPRMTRCDGSPVDLACGCRLEAQEDGFYYRVGFCSGHRWMKNIMSRSGPQ